MPKPLEHLQPQDFVLLKDPSAPLALSRPWRVVGLAGPRVYIDDPDNPRRYVARHSIELVLQDAETARQVYEFGASNAAELERRARALEAEHRSRLTQFVHTLSTGSSHTMQPSP